MKSFAVPIMDMHEHLSRDEPFLAIDFETANSSRDSACALGAVRVEQGQITGRWHWLIRPPTRAFEFTHIHGISWADVAQAPTFADRWPEIYALLADIQTIAAHNAPFDLSVLRACCAQASIRLPPLRVIDTVQLARRKLGIYPTKLPDVCRHLGISLDHHHALSDAEACALIVLSTI